MEVAPVEASVLERPRAEVGRGSAVFETASGDVRASRPQPGIGRPGRKPGRKAFAPAERRSETPAKITRGEGVEAPKRPAANAAREMSGREMATAETSSCEAPSGEARRGEMRKPAAAEMHGGRVKAAETAKAPAAPAKGIAGA